MRVVYVGDSTVRALTGADLSAHGITNVSVVRPLTFLQRVAIKEIWGAYNPTSDLVWARANNYTMDLDVTSDLESLLRLQGQFTLTRINDDGTVPGEPDVPAADPGSIAGVAITDVEGQKRQRVAQTPLNAAPKTTRPVDRLLAPPDPGREFRSDRDR